MKDRRARIFWIVGRGPPGRGRAATADRRFRSLLLGADPVADLVGPEPLVDRRRKRDAKGESERATVTGAGSALLDGIEMVMGGVGTSTFDDMLTCVLLLVA